MKSLKDGTSALRPTVRLLKRGGLLGLTKNHSYLQNIFSATSFSFFIYLLLSFNLSVCQGKRVIRKS